jgi:hypothetical protein
MTSSADVIIPSFPSDVVESLPIYYRAMAQHLAETGRITIEDSAGQPDRKEQS